MSRCLFLYESMRLLHGIVHIIKTTRYFQGEPAPMRGVEGPVFFSFQGKKIGDFLPLSGWAKALQNMEMTRRERRDDCQSKRISAMP